MTRHRQRKRPVPALPPRFHAERSARRTQRICTSAAAKHVSSCYDSSRLRPFLPRSLPLLCRRSFAKKKCGSVSDATPLFSCREKAGVAPGTRAAGTAVDLLLRAARREDSGRSVAQGGGEGGRSARCVHCSSVEQKRSSRRLISFSEATSLAHLRPHFTAEKAFFFFSFKLIVYVSQRLSLPGS